MIYAIVLRPCGYRMPLSKTSSEDIMALRRALTIVGGVLVLGAPRLCPDLDIG